MSSKLAPILGTLSVLVFVGLLGLTVYGVVQGQEDSPAELPQRLSDEGHIGIRLEDVTITCEGSVPRLSVRTSEEAFPDGATLRVVPSRLVAVREDEREYAPVGPVESFSVPASASVVEAALSQSIAAAPAEELSIYVVAYRTDGTQVQQVQSQSWLVDAAEARCNAAQ